MACSMMIVFFEHSFLLEKACTFVKGNISVEVRPSISFYGKLDYRKVMLQYYFGVCWRFLVGPILLKSISKQFYMCCYHACDLFVGSLARPPGPKIDFTYQEIPGVG